MKKRVFMLSELLMLYSFYLINTYFIVSYYFDNHFLVPLSDVTTDNIGKRLLMDTLLWLPTIPTFVVSFHTIKSALNIRNNKRTCIILLGILVFSFCVCRDFSIKGIYIFLYNIFIIAFSEEVLFRGYMYQTLKKINPVFSFFLTGGLFGIPHAIVPAVTNPNDRLSDVTGILITMISLAVWGIINNGIYTYLFIKSNTLFIPIVVHGVGNYFFDYDHAGYADIVRYGTLGYFVAKDIYVHKMRLFKFFTEPRDYV